MTATRIRRIALCSTLCLFAAVPAFAGTQGAATASQQLWYGAAWYPEQWPETAWEKDLALMEAAGVNVVRIAEFSWSTMEPTEGVYDFSWLDRAIRMAERHHIKVVLGTPTDTPPAWLTQKYPATLRVDADGNRAEHGGRRQFSISSPLYREFCRNIVARMAKRYGHDANVVGWQIDNEYTDESFDADTRKQFQDWLERQYKTLDALNAAWSTAYWSQTYSDWRQVPLNARPGNPGWMLDHRRFVTATWKDYQQTQLDVLRATIDPRQFVTTDVGGHGWSDNWDHYEIAKDLDLISWNPYVGQGHLLYQRHGMVSDYVRGWKRQNYWVMETQPGFVNWAPVNNALDKGEVRAMAWESIGHGADAVLFWQWRSALNGQEQYHGNLVAPDGNPVPLYAEAKKIGEEFKTASQAIAGTMPISEVAIITTYDSRWAIDFQPHTALYDQREAMLDYYRPLRETATSVDVVNANAPLGGYKVVFAPGLNVIPADLATHLADYVKQGGHLILGARSGMKDAFNRLNTQRQPGALGDLLGGRIEQYYALDKKLNVHGDFGDGTAAVWGEELSAKAPDAKVILRYGENSTWLSGKPAAVARSVDKGKIVYLGAMLDEKLMRGFVSKELHDAGVTATFPPLPPDVELMRRTGEGRDIYILVNHGAQAATVKLPSIMRDILHDDRSLSTVTLAAQDVAILEVSHAL
jgi:beta-galactosidase